MNSSQYDPKNMASRLLTYLRRLAGDRGAMANLRCALNPTRLPRAWPLLGPVGGVGNPLIETVAGLFAYHPKESSTGNLGTTCLRLRLENNSLDSRFRRLLACDSNEIYERLRPVILAAKDKDIAVNYEQLFIDLWYWRNWRDKVRARWARNYWRPSENEAESSINGMEVMP
jgi:CRISPR system Cascade subunit CasB